ncbi:MEI5 protein [Stagonosporopsis vannaccii]|nr:MEI5 protein [Stagonosporopsis vannaccii]
MAAQTASGHKRADSYMNGVEPAHDALATVQSFCNAVTVLASDHGFQVVNELSKFAPQRELDVKIRDETIQDLKDELVAFHKERDVFNDQQLANFERRYKNWKDENTALKNDIDELEVALEEKDSKMITLQDQLRDLEARAGDLEKENAQMTTKIKERGQQLGILEARLQRAQADLENRAKEVEDARTSMGALQDSFDNEANQHRVLREEASKIRVRLKDFVQFSVKITELDVTDVTNRMEQLWTAAKVLVDNFFGRELPDIILKNDWSGLRDNDVFKHQIPLPQSNTDAARGMRAAVVLGALARLIDKFIFQPTYLLDEQSGLREVLLHEAAFDPVKERYTRGILLSMSPDEQVANSESVQHVVVEELLDTVNVKALLTPQTFDSFPEALSAFVRQFQEEWKIVQRGKQKLEPGFAFLASAKHPSQLFGKDDSNKSNERYPREFPITTAVENNIVLIPCIYLVVSKDEPDPITQGCVLCKAQLDVAAEEMRNSLPSAPFKQASSSRHRNRPGRTMSVSGNNRPFLV